MRKKVAHLVRKLLPPHVTFIRNQIANHIRFDASVVCKEYIPNDLSAKIVDSFPSLCCDVKKNGIRKYYSSIVYSKPFRRLTWDDRKNIRAFISAQRPSILHFHYGTDAGVFIGSTKTMQIPSVVSFYGYDCTSFPDWFFGYGAHYLRNVFANVDYCLAMSENMKADLHVIGCPENKIIVHYYGTDVSEFTGDHIYDGKSQITALIVASLDEKKGHLYILQALGKLAGLVREKVRLRIVGQGPLEIELREYVRTHGLDKIVTFVGPLDYLSRRFLQEFYNADIFVHPSVIASNGDKEGIPGTIVEAMAAGLPVVSTYHAGIPSILKHEETGLLVRERDVDALAACISKLVHDPKLRRRIGQNAQKYAADTLDLRQKQIELEDIYDRVIEEHRTRAKSRVS
jgi:colanic acid/amylovoran biosynthesis glycosyltransferase